MNEHEHYEELKLAEVLKENKARDEKARWANGDLPGISPRELFSFVKHADEDDVITYAVVWMFVAIAIVAIGVLLFALGFLIGTIAKIIATIISALL